MANLSEDFSQMDISKESSGYPVKRHELTQLVAKNYRQRNLPSLVINEAREKLSSIFGYEMRELQQSCPSSLGMVETKSFVIISELPADVYKKYIKNADGSHMTGFTFVVISTLHLAGGKIPEGLQETDERHPVLGDLKQALETLVQQRYLQKDKVSGREGNTLFYELAERALDQLVSDRLKEYISKKEMIDAYISLNAGL